MCTNWKTVFGVAAVVLNALVFAGAAKAQVVTQVTVPNSSFENDPPGTTSRLTGWQQVYGVGTATVVQPTSNDFPIDAGGNLPAPAQGSQALRNTATVPGNDMAVIAQNPLSLPGAGWRPWDDNTGQDWVAGGLQPGYAYTMTVAIGYSATQNGFGWFDSFDLGFVSQNLGMNIMSSEFPNSTSPSAGTFKDFTVTFSADWMLGPTGDPWHAITRHGVTVGYTGARPGDDVEPMVLLGAGSYADNVRVTAATNYSLYWTGGLAAAGGGSTSTTWTDSSTTDRTAANWVASASGGSDSSSNYYQLWTGGCNAVFQGPTAGTVTVSGPVGSVNSIAFTTDGYTLGGAGSITMTGAGGNITTGAGTDMINCTIAGSVGLTKNGAGTLILGGANTYTGPTTINNGTLALGANNALPTASSLILGGGTLATGGFSQTNALGTLTLSSDSAIDMGGIGSSILKFADSHLMSWSGTLTIADWNGSLSGGGADELFLGLSNSGLTQAQLGEIVFVNPDGLVGDYQATILATGEIVPVLGSAPVPEPSTLALSGLGALGLLAYAWRRRKQAA